MRSQQITWPIDLWLAVVNWMDDRFKVRTLMDALLHVHVPREAKTFYLGGITMFLFITQVITGSLLTLYYQATPDTAYDSVLYITSNVHFGWLIRSIHAWGANLMVVFCVLHLLRVYFQGAYKPPRELTWVVGALLLVLTLAFGFTGYLLPWDEVAYWATTVGTESADAIPVVGEYLVMMMRAGPDVTGATLSRFYGVHTLLLPIALAGLLAAHVVLMHQTGIANPRRPARRRAALPPNVAAETQDNDQHPASASPTEEHPATEPEKTIPFFPNYVLGEIVAWYGIIAVLIILASLFPSTLHEKANPLQTPAHIKPEWY
ncbi:MAG: cytochrome bc complex cytochrome b subunit, partial [Anaerolineae bacterium]